LKFPDQLDLDGFANLQTGSRLGRQLRVAFLGTHDFPLEIFLTIAIDRSVFNQFDYQLNTIRFAEVLFPCGTLSLEPTTHQPQG
jgi:hypothetical protein